MNARVIFVAFLLTSTAFAQQGWVNLLAGNSLDAWEIVGDGLWNVMADGTLVGQRVEKESSHQSWVYTVKEYGEFDLELEYWTRFGGNSGVSLRDHTRAKWSHGEQWDRDKTPSHNGYEVQIVNGEKPGKWPTGSIYLFASAQGGKVSTYDWNKLVIESRNEIMRVKVNGKVVVEHPGDPARPKTGPIGLQLHDARSVIMFRKVRIREVR
jgi:3-keto-disaccharide hydrolase